MNEPVGDIAFSLRVLIGFLQTSCEPNPPLSTRSAVHHIKSFLGNMAPVDFAGTRWFAAVIVSFIIYTCIEKVCEIRIAPSVLK